MPSLIQTKRDGTFYIVTSEKGKRVWRSLQTQDRKEANRLFLQRTEKPVKPQKQALKALQNEYLQYMATNHSPKTLEVYKRVFKWFNAFIGRVPISELNARHFDSYKNYRIGKASAHTINQEIRGLRAFFNRLIVWKIIDSSPMRGIKELKIVEKIPPYLTKENLEKLLENTKDSPIHDLILFAAMTGLRKGEIMNLTWNDVDLKKGTILVRSSLIANTKGGKIRTLPINSRVMALLMEREPKEGLVFPGDRGGRYNEDFLAKRFKRAILDCGLDTRLHFHSLRHTFASLLVTEGVSLYHVQRLLGHSSPRITQVYAHLGENELLASVEILCA